MQVFRAVCGTTPEEVPDVPRALIEPTRKEAGCICYDLTRGLGKPAEFAFIEEWEPGEHRRKCQTFREK